MTETITGFYPKLVGLTFIIVSLFLLNWIPALAKGDIGEKAIFWLMALIAVLIAGSGMNLLGVYKVKLGLSQNVGEFMFLFSFFFGPVILVFTTSKLYDEYNIEKTIFWSSLILIILAIFFSLGFPFVVGK